MRIMLLLFLFVSVNASAVEKSYVREYSYKASELDSKVSARKNALDLAKAMLLEEIATYVYSSNDMTQSLAADYQKRFVQNVKNVSAGFLGAKILDESWDGNVFWLRAEFRADPDKIKDELKTVLNTPPATNAAPMTDVSTTTPVYRGYVQQANLASALNMVMPIKTQLHQYYQMMGEWPATFDQMGLKESDMRDGDLLDQVKLGKQGEMILHLSQKFGNKKYLSMKPETIMGGMNIKWTCSTNMAKTDVPLNMGCVIKP